MNQEIKEFWEKKNRIVCMSDRAPEFYTWYIRVEKDPFGCIIAHEYRDGSRTDYFFEGKQYRETQMLTIVRCAAFV